MKAGDLVKIFPNYYGDENSTGIVLEVRKNVEYPLLVEVLWNNGQIARIHGSGLEIIGSQTRD